MTEQSGYQVELTQYVRQRVLRLHGATPSLTDAYEVREALVDDYQPRTALRSRPEPACPAGPHDLSYASPAVQERRLGDGVAAA